MSTTPTETDHAVHVLAAEPSLDPPLGPPGREPTGRPQLESLDDRLVPSTLTVVNNLASAPGSLRDTINLAQSGDTIVFAPSLSGQVIHLAVDIGGATGFDPPVSPTELLIDKNLTIQGPGSGKLTIDGDTVGRVFEIAAGARVTISGLTIQDGNGTVGPSSDPAVNDGSGGAILNEGTLTLNDCWVTNSVARGYLGTGWGGGIANFGTMTMSGCWVVGNTAVYGGGVYNTGKLTVSGCTVTSNTAVYDGGGVYNTGSLTVTGSTVAHNTASNAKLADLDSLGTFSASSSTIGNKKYR